MLISSDLSNLVVISISSSRVGTSVMTGEIFAGNKATNAILIPMSDKTMIPFYLF